MSFAKYVLFRFIKWIGRLLAIGGLLLILAGIAGLGTESETVLGVGVLLLIVGILMNWYGAFRAKAEQIRRGIKG